MFRAQRLPALVVALSAVSLSLWGVAGGLATATAATTNAVPQTFYFHGAGQGQDDVNRANGTPSATFNAAAPTGTSDSTQTGTGNANPDSAENPLAVYWVGKLTGHISGTMHFDWYWSTANPTTVVAGETATVTIFGDGTKIGSGDVALTIGTSPTLNHSDVAGVDGDAVHELVVQVAVDHADTGRGVTAHYDSTSAPSSFTVPVAPLPPPGNYDDQPTCSGTFCFSAPAVLPKSGDTGSTSATCYNPCGEPSLITSPAADGTMYVSTPRTLFACCNTQASPVWKSSDNGRTWSDPIFPSGAENATTGGDTELAVDKRGTVYEGELWLGSDSIYISGDHGGTWDWSPASHDLLADREWFVYSPTEDALYGYYDGIKGLMVVKAPLGTPAGSHTAQFFPQERIAVPEWDDCPGVIAGPCVEKPSQVPDEVNGTPILKGTTSPGRPTVSPVDGTLYFPFPYQVAGKGVGLAVTKDGLNFTYSYVDGAGHGVFGDTGNDFAVSAVDKAGNVYVAWVEDKGDGYNVYYAGSPDKGTTWSPPVELSKGVSQTAVFPNIVAGAAGQIAVSWYGSQEKNDPNSVTPAASWDVYASSITNALSKSPSTTTDDIQSGFHLGPICTHGIGCNPPESRNLLDFFDMQFDKTGNLGIVYARDQFANRGKTEIAFAYETSGCNLTSADCGPSANVSEFPSTAAPAIIGALMLGSVVLLRRRRAASRP